MVLARFLYTQQIQQLLTFTSTHAAVMCCLDSPVQ